MQLALFDQFARTCPQCGSNLVRKQGRFGEFVACSNYPTCKYVQQKTTGVKCPTDGGEIVVLQLVDPAETPRKKPTNVTPRRRAAKARYALLERKSPKAAQPAAEAPATETPATEPPAPEAPKTDAPKE